MKRSDAFPSQYVSQADVQAHDLAVTIATIKMDEIKTGESENEIKPVLTFREPDMKALVLNGTNWDTIADAYGPDSDGWIGKKITLYFDPNVKFGSKRVGGVRVRISPGAGTGTLTWPQIIELAHAVGMSEADLKAKCKAAGMAGYTAGKDEPQVRSIIDAERARKQQDAAAEAFPKNDDTIPF